MTIPVTGVSELVLEVDDLAAAERFYSGVLGLPVVERWAEREAIWVMAGDRTRIGLWRPQVGVAGGRGGEHVHFALHVAEDAFDAAVGRLREAGLAPHVQDRRRDSRSVYVDDPDGNCVELWTKDVAGYLPRFEHRASEWDASYGARTTRGHWQRARLEAAVRLVGEGPGSLLEVGVGSGRLLARLAERGWDVVGIDAAPRMLELTRARVPGVKLEVARAEELPFEDASFDVVVAVGVLEYADPEASLRELARVLRPAGRAVLGVRNSAAPTVAWSSHVMHPLARRVKRVLPFGRRLPSSSRRPPPLRALSELLERVGLQVERVENVGSAVLPDPFDRLPFAYRAARLAEASPPLRAALGTQRLIAARRTNPDSEEAP
jgi:ubiquinone/menaquinone biosynthesis C-methylase UbiE/catechol 2,3-dioxygenase-like lactoylglutathione lyase family enzyme